MPSAKSEVRSVRQKWRRRIRTAAFPLIVSIATLLMATSEWRREQRLMRQTATIRTHLETFPHENGRFPDSLAQSSIAGKEKDSISHQSKAETSHLLWFGMEIGESNIFRSIDGQQQ